MAQPCSLTLLLVGLVQIYEYYERPEAWSVTPGAVEALGRLRSAGVRLAVVSNFDTRLRPLLDSLNLTDLFDEIIVSAEVRPRVRLPQGRLCEA